MIGPQYFGWQMHTFGIFQAASKATLFTRRWSPRSGPGQHAPPPPPTKWQFYLKIRQHRLDCVWVRPRENRWVGASAWSHGRCLVKHKSELELRNVTLNQRPRPGLALIRPPDLMTGISQVKKELWSGQQRIPQPVFTQKYNLIFSPGSEATKRLWPLWWGESGMSDPDRKKCRVWRREARAGPSHGR